MWFPTIGPDAKSNTNATMARLLTAIPVFEFISVYHVQLDKVHLESTMNYLVLFVNLDLDS